MFSAASRVSPSPRDAGVGRGMGGGGSWEVSCSVRTCSPAMNRRGRGTTTRTRTRTRTRSEDNCPQFRTPHPALRTRKMLAASFVPSRVVIITFASDWNAGSCVRANGAGARVKASRPGTSHGDRAAPWQAGAVEDGCMGKPVTMAWQVITTTPPAAGSGNLRNSYYCVRYSRLNMQRMEIWV